MRIICVFITYGLVRWIPCINRRHGVNGQIVVGTMTHLDKCVPWHRAMGAGAWFAEASRLFPAQEVLDAGSGFLKCYGLTRHVNGIFGT